METTATLRHALRTDRERTLTRIYQRAFPMARRYVQQHGGTDQDAKDVFQDAVVILYEKAVAEDFVLSASVSTYLVGICRNLWRREVARRQRQPLTSLAEEHAQLPDDYTTAAAEPAAPSVLDYLAQLGDKCQRMLLAFYYFQEPLAQIAADHQYGSVRSATVQKFKCLERLRKAVRNVLITEPLTS